MSTTHVFIVDHLTLKYHLEYMFAGTGAGNKFVDFNNTTTTSNVRIENGLAAMIADISRIRIGDSVLFYLQQKFEEGINEGKFYGIFKVASAPFLDNLKHITNTLTLSRNYNIKSQNEIIKIHNKDITINNVFSDIEKNKFLLQISNAGDKTAIETAIIGYYSSNQYLLKELQKSLTFRIKIEPLTVYEDGVTEWEALDVISSISSPFQMLWSLIYRKLVGNRGCTAITIYESQKLCDLIRQKNNRVNINLSSFPTTLSLSYDKTTQKITTLNTAQNSYTGISTTINLKPRMIQKYDDGLSFEYHLHVFILNILGKNVDANLDSLLLENRELKWLGNEVSCGVGMQSIDIAYSTIQHNSYFHYCVELKADIATQDIIPQIQRYVDWMRMYYLPNLPGDLIPVIITKKIPDSKSGRWKWYKHEANGSDSAYYGALLNSFRHFNTVNTLNLKFIEFEIVSNNIKFEEIIY